MTIVIFFRRIEKCRNRTKKKYSRVHIGRFDYSPFFYFASKTLAIQKKIAIVFGNWWKVADYTGCQIKFIVQHFAHFWPFLKALADKLMPHSQISCKSWLNNVALELLFSLKNIAMLASKHWFSDCLSWMLKVECLTTRAFLTTFKGRRQKKNWCHLFKSVLKLVKSC